MPLEIIQWPFENILPCTERCGEFTDVSVSCLTFAETAIEKLGKSMTRRFFMVHRVTMVATICKIKAHTQLKRTMHQVLRKTEQ